MTQKKGRKRANPQENMLDAEHVAAELAKAESMDDFFGKDGIFAKLFANMKLDTAAVSAMTYALVVDKKDPADYAKEWVKENEDTVLSWLSQ